MVRLEEAGQRSADLAVADLPIDLVRGRNASAFVKFSVDSPEIVLRGSEAHLSQPPNSQPIATHSTNAYTVSLDQVDFKVSKTRKPG